MTDSRIQSKERLAEIAAATEGATEVWFPEFDYNDPLDYKSLRKLYMSARGIAFAVPELLAMVAALQEEIYELRNGVNYG